MKRAYCRLFAPGVCCAAVLWVMGSPAAAGAAPDYEPWFGAFIESPFAESDAGGWGRHGEHGYVYAVAGSPTGFWFWDLALQWMWAEASIHPFMYSYGRISWLWYYRGTVGPRWFTDMMDPDNPFPDNAVPPPVDRALAIEDLVVSDVTHRSARVEWSTTLPAGGAVEFGVSESELDQVADIEDEGRTVHALVLTDLEEETLYFLRVRAEDAHGKIVYSEIASFETGIIAHGMDLTLADVGTSGFLAPSASIVTTAHGQVIENLEVFGTITINHNNVTVRNVRVLHGNGTNGITVSSGTSGIVIEHCELDGRGEVLGNFGSLGVVLYGEATVRRCYALRLRTGFHIPGTGGSGSVIVENYVGSLTIRAGSHNASASIHGGGTVAFLRNRFIESNSSALSLYAANAPLSDVLVQDNFFVGANSGYGLYGGYTHPNNGHRDSNRDIRVIGNRWQPPFRWGPVAAFHDEQPGAVWEDNAFVSGATIPPKRDI